MREGDERSGKSRRQFFYCIFYIHAHAAATIDKNERATIFAFGFRLTLRRRGACLRFVQPTLRDLFPGRLIFQTLPSLPRHASPPLNSLFSAARDKPGVFQRPAMFAATSSLEIAGRFHVPQPIRPSTRQRFSRQCPKSTPELCVVCREKNVGTRATRGREARQKDACRDSGRRGPNRGGLTIKKNTCQKPGLKRCNDIFLFPNNRHGLRSI